MSNPNPFIPYAYFPKKKEVPEPVIDNFCEILGHVLEPDRNEHPFCRCGKCPSLSSSKECLCCFDIAKASTKLAKNWKDFIANENECFSSDPKIVQIVGNKLELDDFIKFDQIRLKQIARLTKGVYVDEYGYSEENLKYRFACFRKINMFVHDLKGTGKGIQIPACIIGEVRKIYSSESYESFEELFGEYED